MLGLGLGFGVTIRAKVRDLAKWEFEKMIGNLNK